MVITRPSNQSSVIYDLVRKAGGEGLAIPVLDILPAKNQARFAAEVKRNLCADFHIFVSQHAAKEISMQWYQQQIGATGELIAVGQSTASRLEGISEVTIPSDGEYTSEGVLKLSALQNLANKHVIIYRGQSGRETLKQQLQRRGATVTYVEAYQRRSICTSIEAKKLEKLRSAKQLAVLCTSVQSGQGLATRLTYTKESLPNTAKVIVPSERVKLALDEYFPDILVADSAMDEAMLAAITER